MRSRSVPARTMASDGRMRRRAVVVPYAVCTALVAGPATAAAQSNFLSLGSAPALLWVSNATAGQPPTSVTATSSYTFSTAASRARLRASLSSAPAAGVTIEVSAAVPATATSNGYVALSTAAQNIATIPVSLSGTYTLTYRVTATSAAGVLAAAARTVTVSLVAY